MAKEPKNVSRPDRDGDRTVQDPGDGQPFPASRLAVTGPMAGDLDDDCEPTLEVGPDGGTVQSTAEYGPTESQEQIATTQSDAEEQSLEERIRDKMRSGTGARIRKDAMIGRTIGGRYTITSKIGAGGMGIVYKASQKGMDRNVAVKVLLKEYLTNETAVRRFQREALAVSKLEHPNTVRIYDFGETAEDHLLFIAMEFLPGVPLQRLLTENQQVSVRTTLRVVQQICRSLNEAHGKGIVHRDLKPDNVFVGAIEGQQDFVKVLDFGVAKLREGSDERGTLTQHGVIFGTPKYMSPEQCKSQEVEARSDLYSVGVMMHEMLSGRVPFESDNPLAILIMHAQDPVRALSEVRPDLVIPAEVEELMHLLLEKEPQDRPQSAKVVIDHCEKLLNMIPDEFEDVVTWESAARAGMDVDRSKAFTVEERMRGLTSEMRARHARRIDQERDTIAVDAPPLPTPRWKIYAGLGFLFVVLVFGLLAYVYTRITGLPAPTRRMIPELVASADALPPLLPDLVTVSARANVANVTVIDPATGEVLGEIPNANEVRTFRFLREPGRKARVMLKHGSATPIEQEVDLGSDVKLPLATFDVDPAAPAVEMVTLTVRTNVPDVQVHVLGRKEFYRTKAVPAADGSPGEQGREEIRVPKGAAALEIEGSRAGYQSARTSFAPAESGAVDLTLAKLPEPAVPDAPITLTVSTNVGKVKVRVEATGQVFETSTKGDAPLLIPLPRGEEEVALSFERPGYEPETRRVRPSADVALHVELQRRKGAAGKPDGPNAEKPGGEVPKVSPIKEPKDGGSLKIGRIKGI